MIVLMIFKGMRIQPWSTIEYRWIPGYLGTPQRKWYSHQPTTLLTYKATAACLVGGLAEAWLNILWYLVCMCVCVCQNTETRGSVWNYSYFRTIIIVSTIEFWPDHGQTPLTIENLHWKYIVPVWFLYYRNRAFPPICMMSCNEM